MSGMAKHSAEGDHYANAPRRDHLWVLAVIAVCALLEVWASWLAIGSMSGFPRIGGARGLPTDWTLAVTTEAYWGYALYSWLAAAPGPRSRAFAMWSAIAVFILSLTGQGAAHLVKPGQQPPAVLVVFVTALPVLVLALIAILVHLRQADRERIEARAKAAAEAERKAAVLRAEADERTLLRAELERVSTSHEADLNALREQFTDALESRDRALAATEEALETARSEAAAAQARAERLERKLAGPAGRSRSGTGRSRAGTAAGRGTAPEDDLELEARALKLLATDLTMSGADLARKLGVSEGYGRKLRRRLTGDRPSEADRERAGDRTGTAPGDRGEDRA